MTVEMANSIYNRASSQWNKLESILATTADGATCSDDDKSMVRLDSQSLDLASVVAVSRLATTTNAAQIVLLTSTTDLGPIRILMRRVFLEFGGVPRTSKRVWLRGRLYMVRESSLFIIHVVEILSSGVNTGFGGSADTRNSHVNQLQQTLIRELHYGILADTRPSAKSVLLKVDGLNDHQAGGTSTRERTVPVYENGLPLDDPTTASCMPESWVRAAILIRINSLVSGHSGVREVVVARMIDLLKHGIIPRIPLRGSISASGDLSPLSYVGGVLQGKPTLTVWADDPLTGNRRITTARQALAEKSLEPIRLEAKEGLAIVNGTAISCAVGALAIFEAQNLAVLSQVLAAMSVEALKGSIESFDPLFAALRPHPGQIESARSIYCLLSGSHLVAVNDGSEEGSLRQDRYSIRTASQWLGPSLEDLSLANQQITTECNSVTDNPLIDDKGRMLHGGNFQAKAVTSAMEKTRLALQTIGQMIFTQCTELINPATNRGLPPNLVADEPGESFIFKGIDLMVAALQSELGFLSNPAGTYVQPAEMGNQALNSLALISARYTHTAVDVLSQLAACHLMALCQAFDLRAMHSRFRDDFQGPFRKVVKDSFGLTMNEADLLDFCDTLWQYFDKQLGQTMTMDSGNRIHAAVSGLQVSILTRIATEKIDIGALKDWKETCTVLALSSYRATREKYLAHPDATPLLGQASKRMYGFVRHDLGIPFLLTRRLLEMETQSSAFEDPIIADDKGPCSNGVLKAEGSRSQKSDHSEDAADTVGSFIGRIHHAIRTGRLFAPVMAAMQDSSREAWGA